MVTNINLTSPEISEKKSFSGKAVLISSFVILAVVITIYGALSFLNSRYAAEEIKLAGEISQEEGMISGTKFADIFDFHDRLNLADKVIDDHAYWDNLLKRMSAYVIPEVRLSKFSGQKDGSGGGTIEITGTAPSLDVISRELILLKDFPNLDSLEFKNAGQGTGSGGQPGELTFVASLKINKAAFQK